MGSTDTFLIRCPACGTMNSVPRSSEGRSGKCGSCHGRLPPLYTEPLTMTDGSFDAFAGSYPGTILAEFWAPW